MFLSVLILVYQTLLITLYAIPCLGQTGCSGDLAGVLSLLVPLTHIQRSLVMQRQGGGRRRMGRQPFLTSVAPFESLSSWPGRGMPFLIRVFPHCDTEGK